MAHTSLGDGVPRNRSRELVRRTLLGAFSIAFGVALAVPGWTQALVGRDRTPPDLMGEWTVRDDEDPGQPTLGDYLGMPFNDAGRMRADTSAESIWGTAEYRCRPHSAPHSWRGVGGARILKDLDPLTRDVTGYHFQYWRSLDRPVYLDNRPHPPGYAPHSWAGFATAEWQGDTLVIKTTHFKDGFLQRGGPQTSDVYTMTEYLTRHDEYLTVTQIVDDPVYLDEPYVVSTVYEYEPNSAVQMESCVTTALGDGGGSPYFVPHFLPGENTALQEWLVKENWVPVEPTRGGAVTAYPEYRISGKSAKAPISHSTVSVQKAVEEQSPRDGEVHVLPVQSNVYMLVADGTNITASVGRSGVLAVDAGSRKMSDKVLATITQLQAQATSAVRPNECNGSECIGLTSWASPSMNAVIASPAPARPIRFIINTNASPDHVGGNEVLAKAGYFARKGGTNVENGAAATAAVIAHENVLTTMQNGPGGDSLPLEALPSDTYSWKFQKISEYVNGEGVEVYHEPNAISDGDSIVQFRRSEVISTGDIYSTVTYPMINVKAGGTIDGEIDALNHVLDLTAAEYRSQGGTWIIPGRGRLSDAGDLASYRNMIVIIHDRIQKLKKQGKTLEQVLAGKITLDFDVRYGLDKSWTPAQFAEAVYRTLPTATRARKGDAK
jgi:glyoxylase-like metal-dependent hydrolase (beta-lactamase superfamily II)